MIVDVMTNGLEVEKIAAAKPQLAAVCVNGLYSSPSVLKSGVLQGSILVPYCLSFALHHCFMLFRNTLCA